SRRRHTRCSRDWSSDVCSSDLDAFRAPLPAHALAERAFGTADPLFAKDEVIAAIESASAGHGAGIGQLAEVWTTAFDLAADPLPDRKSTRLNSSHVKISYAVFC